MMLLVVPGMSVTVRRAASSAVSSALVLLQTLPAATRTSRFSPEGSWIRAPPPPRATPASAEPSVHTQTASSGRVARCSSAAARRTVSGAPLPPAIPASKQKEMPAVEVHGGRVTHRRGSMGTPATSAAASASRPAVLHPVTLESREGARASPTALRGSPGGGHPVVPGSPGHPVVRRSSASPRWTMEGHCAPALGVASAWWKPNGTPTCLPRPGACGRHRDDIYTDLSSTSPSQRRNSSRSSRSNIHKVAVQSVTADCSNGMST